MGYIELVVFVVYIWFFKLLLLCIGLMLDMMLCDLECILYFENYVVIEFGLIDLIYGQLMIEEEFMDVQDQYGVDVFIVNIGVEVICEMLVNIDLVVIVE